MATINGTAANDVLQGGTENDVIDGGDGADRMNGGAGNDVIYGREGNDTLTGDAGNDVLYGGEGNDGFFGGGNDDAIYGEAGDDTMYGDAGNDTLAGGVGNDKLFGGTGNDTFVHRVGEGVDQIQGGSGVDKVVIELSTSQLTAEVRADLVRLEQWMADQLESAGGSMTTLAGQTSGGSLVLSALGLTLSTFEQVSYVLDGQPVAVSAMLNKAPEAAELVRIHAQEDAEFAGQIQARDADGDALTFELVTAPEGGTVTLDPATGAYVYKGAANFSGRDYFEVRVTDPSGASVVQIIDVTVAGVADAASLTVEDASATAPTASLKGTNQDDVIDASGSAMVKVPLSISAGLVDVDGSETLSITISNVPVGATLSAGVANPDGTWTLTAADLVGLVIETPSGADYSFVVTATTTEADGHSTTSSTELAVTFVRPETTTTSTVTTIVGGLGNDRITGTDGDDLIYGGTTLREKAGQPKSLSDDDVIRGGDGRDDIRGMNGDDELFGEAGDDKLSGGNGNDKLDGGDGNDKLDGGAGNDWLSDGAGNDVVRGGRGNDVVLAGDGNDDYRGGGGFDTLDFSGAAQGMTIDVGKKTAVGAGNDKFSGFEMVVGSTHADKYTGSSGVDRFNGGDGNDVIRSLAGADILTGGEGDDTFAFFKKDVVHGNKHLGVDRITDFEAGDRLDLQDLLKGMKGAAGDNIKVRDGDDGSIVSVKVDGKFVDVALLENVHGLSANEMLSSGMILT